MANTNIQKYIAKHPHWIPALNALIEMLRATELVEEIKWGAPVYTLDKKHVVGTGAFKSYVGLWFFQGVFLKDKEQKLINAQEGKTKGMRQWRFNSLEEIEADRKLIKQYLAEAIANQKAGKEIKVERNKKFLLPGELRSYLDTHSDLRDTFKALSPGKQREFAEYIREAKMEATKMKRIEKIALLIKEGKGLYDHYKK